MKHRIVTTLAALALTAAPLMAQRVVVSHDEWITNNAHLTPGSTQRRFIDNTLNWFGVGAGDRVLTWSGNQIAYINSPLSSVITSRGATYSQTTATPLNLSQYKTIFVGGFAIDNTALINYVLGGGNVVLLGGTCTRLAAGVGCDTDAGQEAADWQPFLQRFGMGFAGQYNGFGTVNTAAFAGQGPFGAALFTGVSSLFADNGSSVLTTIGTPADVTRQLFNVAGGPGVFGAATVAVIPEPTSILLLATGALGLLVTARRRRR
jgi:hypothetical protein